MTENGNGYSKRWADLLDEAVRLPGKLHECYRAFYGYSIGNCWLAMMQCLERDIPVGPIATYKRWQAQGRQVKRGEKALSLWMPLSVKEREKNEDGDVAETGNVLTIFRLLPRWFVYAQTEGDEIEPQTAVGDWALERALPALDIRQVAFDLLSGNCQGFASERTFAVNPVAVMPLKTSIHEVAHIVLGHTAEGGRIVDGEALARSLIEAEAESVALIVSDTLGLPGQEYSRGYIQKWLAGEADAIPERSARRIFSAADKILKAGVAQAVAVPESMKEAA